MRVGIDLDNTVICYDEVFSHAAKLRGLIPEDWSGNKYQVRKRLRSAVDGEAIWRAVQGDVYGRLISRATLYSGVFRFLWRCHVQGIYVEIVSHKTEFGHGSEDGVPLRKAALWFLKREHLYLQSSSSFIDRVTFLNTREEKLAYIAEHNFDWFVDDLPEVLDNCGRCDRLKKIGFAPDQQVDFASAKKVSSWAEIENQILGPWTKDELVAAAGDILGERPKQVLWIGGRRNSGVAKVCLESGKLFAMKIYASDAHHNRYRSEQAACDLLYEHGVGVAPRFLGGLENIQVGMLEWIPGVPVSQPGLPSMEQILHFTRHLHDIRASRQSSIIPRASASVFSGLEIEQQLSQRLEFLEQNSIDSQPLHSYLEREFVPALREMTGWIEANWSGGHYEKLLEDNEMTLSPSDFGFHNCLKLSDGSIRFIDFEYFGWDDPAKLCTDFLFHPGMTLSDRMARRWLQGLETIYGAVVIERARRIWGLIGLVWCLILLNDFRRDTEARRQAAKGNVEPTSLEALNRRLLSSRNLLGEVQSQYKDPEVFNQI